MHHKTHFQATVLTDQLPLAESESRYACIPDHADESVSQDTIYLYDPTFSLPERSLTRRRTFQILQNRYCHQILYGCANSHCKTPTCLSHQKQVSKQPFRQYTVLSARTLATTLASGDKPEKGLCPHPKVHPNLDPVSRPKPLDEGARADFDSDEASRHVLQDRKFQSHGCTSQCGNVQTQITKAKPRLMAEKGVLAIPPYVHRGNGIESTGAFRSTSRTRDSVRKDKDAKSFAQSVFDTTAMTLLQLAKIPEDYLGWAHGVGKRRSRNEPARPFNHIRSFGRNVSPQHYADGSSENQQRTESSIVSPCTDLGSTTKASSSQEPSPIQQDGFLQMKAEMAPIDRGIPLPPGCSGNEDYHATAAHEPSSLTSKKLIDSRMEPRLLDNENGLSTGNLCISDMSPHLQACAQSILMAGSKQSLSSGIGSTQQRKQTERRPDAQTSEKDSVSLGIVEGTSAFRTREDDSDRYTMKPPQSLSHFSDENVAGLASIAKEYNAGLFTEYDLLRSQGRVDSPLDTSTHSSEQIERCRQYLSFTSQSLSYVLTNPEALMQSFLHGENVTSSPDLVQSYELSYLIECCRYLRHLDFHPLRIFPSLWTTVGQLHPCSHRSRLENDMEHLPPSTYNDVETYHIAKIVFAALIGSVPVHDAEVVNLFRILRNSDEGTLRLQRKDIGLSQKTVTELSRIVDAFEDEMALSVMTRLAKVIAVRRYKQDISQESEERVSCATSSSGNSACHFFGFMIQYLFADTFKILRFNNRAPPTVKSGQLVESEQQMPRLTNRLPLLIVIEWLRTVILKEWDRKARVLKCSAVGGALGLLDQIYKIDWLKVKDEIFHIPFISERLDVVNMPPDWITAEQDATAVHLLSYPFLFSLVVLTSYFRAINYDTMYKAFEEATRAKSLITNSTFTDTQHGRGTITLQDRIKVMQSKYLVLQVRRDNVLTDAMDQLWKRQISELSRPLKVRMGTEEGEEGLDHGGVQQEFFRVAVAEAMNPDYGAFETDSQTRMTWFRASSLEPLYKFELLGLITSLAVFNGLMLPFTFPLALYRKLLDVPVTELDDIEDGWPSLTRSLRLIRDSTDDNIEDVFMIPYTFGTGDLGTAVKMDKARKQALPLVEERQPLLIEGEIQRLDHGLGPDRLAVKKPSQTVDLENNNDLSREERAITNYYSSDVPSEQDSSDSFSSSSTSSQTNTANESEPLMVTKANREQYIKDYITYLIHISIEPQWNAFRKGFFKCIKPQSISLFSTTQLKALVEGLTDISVDELQKVTTYEGGFYEDHTTIRRFWGVVQSWPQEKVRKLLEFVTASDRLPADGMARLTFIILRSGDDDDGRLPTSSTCFGRLFLPEYSDEHTLRRALEMAVEHSKGFGAA